MRLKKVNQNTSKLFCALFMLGMNVYGVDRQGNVYHSGASNGNGQTDTMMYDVQRNTLSQSVVVYSEKKYPR